MDRETTCPRLDEINRNAIIMSTENHVKKFEDPLPSKVDRNFISLSLLPSIKMIQLLSFASEDDFCQLSKSQIQ